MRRTIQTVFAGLACALAGASCVAPSVGAKLRYYDFAIDGDFAANTGGASAANTTDDLGLDDGEGALAPRVDLGWLGTHLTLSATDTSFEGNGTLSAQIDAGGVTLPVAEPVRSELDLAIYNAMLTFDLVPTGTVDFGIGPGLAVVDFEAAMTSLSTMETARTDETVPIPVLAARLHGQLGKIEIGGDLGWMNITVDDDSLEYVDLDVAARWIFTSTAGRARGGLEIGYRTLDVELDYDDSSNAILFDAKVDGPYIGLVFTL